MKDLGLPTIAVDTHVFRVSNRTGLAYGKNPDEVQENLYKIVPKKYLKKRVIPYYFMEDILAKQGHLHVRHV